MKFKIRINYFFIFILLFCFNLCFSQEFDNNRNDSVIIKKNNKEKFNTENNNLSKREAKKIAKIFLKKNLGWKTYFKNKPYAASLVDDHWYFYGETFFHRKKFKRIDVTAKVNVFNGSTVVFIRK